jgi:predicted nucleotidyltransferase
VRLREELHGEIHRREQLAERVAGALRADERVVSVGLIGSLNGGKADEFSDIDLGVHLRGGVADREFFLDVPSVLVPVGSAVAGWGFTSLPDEYVATFHFDDYPLLWSVDVACISDVHVDGSDLVSEYRWEQIYKMWIGAVKCVARGETKVADVHRLVARHVSVEVPESNFVEQLSALLAGIESRKRASGDPYLAMHRRCEELLKSLT